METLHPASYILNSNLFLQEKQSTFWTKEEDKRFESALAIYDKETPDRWFKIAALIPGKTALDVMKRYGELEADVCNIEEGRVPVPGYFGSSLSFDLVGVRNFDGFRKKSLGNRNSDHERKKGVPWTEDEHRRFLMGLLKYGKGDWRNISRNYVITKTPTQVASHAQKYFIRQLSGGKDKKRPSIHDITTVSLTETALWDSHKPVSLDLSSMLQSSKRSTSEPKEILGWNQPNDTAFVVLNSTFGTGEICMKSLQEIDSKQQQHLMW